MTRDTRPVLCYFPSANPDTRPLPPELIDKQINPIPEWPKPRVMWHMPAGWLGGGHKMPLAQWLTLDKPRQWAWRNAARRVRDAGGTVGVYIGWWGVSAFTLDTLDRSGKHTHNPWALLSTVRGMRFVLSASLDEVWLDNAPRTQATIDFAHEVMYQNHYVRVGLETATHPNDARSYAALAQIACMDPGMLFRLLYPDREAWPPAPDGCEQVLYSVWRPGANTDPAVQAEIIADITRARELGYVPGVNVGLARIPAIREAVLV